MDGIHDLGGMIGFGPVEVEADEPVFHEPWEGRVFALAGPVLSSCGVGTPVFRHAIERMDPAHYLASSYYEHWLTAFATLAAEHGVVDRDELRRRAGGFPLSRPSAADPVPPALDGQPAATPRFGVGERVRVRNVHPLGHTRCPGYVRDRVGKVARVHPPAPVAELEAHGRGIVPETAYAVRFACVELWGDADSGASVHVDLGERYLEPMSA